MSNKEDLTIGELIHLLPDTYRAIDLRAILLKEKKEWECIYLILRMTILDQEKLELIHEDKRSLTKGQHPNGRLVYEHRASSHINSIIHQIDNAHIPIGTYTAKLESVHYTSKKKTKTENGYTISEDSAFPHKVLVVPFDYSNTNPLKRLENHGIKSTDLGLTWILDINSCFDVTNLYDPYYLIFVFPVYARILECYPNEVEKKLLSKFQIHDSILSKSKI
jgi:hypothetical protein